MADETFRTQNQGQVCDSIPATITTELDRLLARAGSRAKGQPVEIDWPDREREIALANIQYELGSRYACSRVRLDRFEVYSDRQPPVLHRLKLLAASIGEFCQAGRGIIFLGPVGSGKDHLQAAMLYEAAAAGISCRWVNGQEVYGQFRDRMDGGGKEDELLRSLSESQVLAISDPIPPVGTPSAWNIAQLYRLIDRRYRQMKSTWLSVNAISIEDADAKLSAPVFDRLRELAEIFACFWPSYRERKR